ncbi:tetratricopeptide repeat protein [Bradyrhizobium manausense]
MPPADEDQNIPVAAGSGQPEASSESEEKRDPNAERAARLIGSIVNEMRARAANGEITNEDLRNAYTKNNEIEEWFRPTSGKKRLQPNVNELSFNPSEIKTYGHLFGAGDWGHQYISLDGKRAKSLPQVRHVRTLGASLKLLGICDKTEAPLLKAKEPATWLPFLESALKAINPEFDVTYGGTFAAASPPSHGANDQKDNAQPISLKTEGEQPREVPAFELAQPAPKFLVQHLRAIAAVAVVAVLVLSAAIIKRFPAPPPRNTPIEAAPETASQGTDLAAPVPAGTAPFLSILDLKAMLGAAAGTDQSNASALPISKLDPRMAEAERLSAAGDQAAADRLTKEIGDDWARAVVVGNKIGAETHRQRGAHAYGNRNYDGSIDEYSQAINADATADDYQHRGLAYQESHRLAEALGDYSEAIRRAPDTFASAYNNRGNVYQDQNPANLDGAISDYTQAIKIDNQMAFAFNNRGNAYQRKGLYDLAMKDYQEAIRLDPGYAYPHNGLGNVYDQLNQTDKAIASYSAAIKINSNYTRALINRGYAQFAANKFEQAIADFDRAIDLIKKSPGFDKNLAARTYAGRGLALNITLKPDKAIPDFGKAIELDAGLAMAYAGRGSAYGALQKDDLAFKDFAESIERDPAAVPAYMMRSSLYSARGKLDQAIADYDKMISLAPDQAWGYFGRAMARARLNDRSGFLDDLQKAAERAGNDPVISSWAETYKLFFDGDYVHALNAMEPMFSEAQKNNLLIFPSALILRAQIYAAKGDLDPAIADYDHALEVDPHNYGLYLSRGKIFEQKGDARKAIADYGQVLENDPANVPALLARGKALYESHSDTAAEADLNAIIKGTPSGRDRAEAHLYLGHIYIANDPDRAIKEYQETIDARVGELSVAALFSRGRAFDAKKDFDHAIQDYSEVLKVSPRSTDVYGIRARAYRALGQFPQSISDFTVQTINAKRSPRPWDNRGDTYYAAGKFPKAVEDYSLAVQADDKFVDGHFDLGKAYYALGQYDLAAQSHARAAALDPGSVRIALRLYIARVRAGDETAKGKLEESAKHLDQSEPLYPVASLFLGRTPVDGLSAPRDEDDRCETQLYTGEWYLLQGSKTSAAQSLGAALVTCSKADMPYYDAKIALDQMH